MKDPAATTLHMMNNFTQQKHIYEQIREAYGKYDALIGIVPSGLVFGYPFDESSAVRQLNLKDFRLFAEGNSALIVAEHGVPSRVVSGAWLQGNFYEYGESNQSPPSYVNVTVKRVQVEGVHLERASLEEIFLTLTGGNHA